MSVPFPIRIIAVKHVLVLEKIPDLICISKCTITSTSLNSTYQPPQRASTPLVPPLDSHQDTRSPPVPSYQLCSLLAYLGNRRRPLKHTGE